MPNRPISRVPCVSSPDRGPDLFSEDAVLEEVFCKRTLRSTGYYDNPLAFTLDLKPRRVTSGRTKRSRPVDRGDPARPLCFTPFDLRLDRNSFYPLPRSPLPPHLSLPSHTLYHHEHRLRSDTHTPSLPHHEPNPFLPLFHQALHTTKTALFPSSFSVSFPVHRTDDRRSHQIRSERRRVPLQARGFAQPEQELKPPPSPGSRRQERHLRLRRHAQQGSGHKSRKGAFGFSLNTPIPRLTLSPFGTAQARTRSHRRQRHHQIGG